MNLERIARKFQVEGDFIEYEPITIGHINDTYLLHFNNEGEDKYYILQRINSYVFKKPVNLMMNIENVTNHLYLKLKDIKKDVGRYVLHFYKAFDGRCYLRDEVGKYWRLYKYVNDSETYNYTDNLMIIEESGKAFGEFQNYLADYDANNLFITIPDFHNTKKRYNDFKNIIKEDPYYRSKGITDLIDEVLGYEDLVCEMYKMFENGELPLRVTHNDTKFNNVLFDINDYKHLAVIDLDTVMPGLIGFDFGDAVRFACNSSSEDEKDLSKVYLNIDKFKAFSKGFLREVKDKLTEKEVNTLVLGALTMTIECGMRFLGDYLSGDLYFKTEYLGHNLVRAKCQLALGKDIISKRKELEEIIRSFVYE